MPYVDGAGILAHAGVSSPSQADEDWADVCAAAVEAAIEHQMDGVTVDPGSAAEAELTRAALDDGAAAYARRKAPHGVLTVGPNGESVRLGADIVIALRPVFRRYATPGIG